MAHQDLNDFAQSLDAIYARELAALGSQDAGYIRRTIRHQRWLALCGRLLIFSSLLCLPRWDTPWADSWSFGLLIGAGILVLAAAKIIENMEIGHNILHAQWNWMNDPRINSNTWEWDHACASAQWRNTHNVNHHVWTNVIGIDRDIGYGMLRVSSTQRWHPFYLLQPLNVLLMAIFFEWFIALHDLEIPRIVKGKADPERTHAKLHEFRAKAWKQIRKDYILWPLLAGPLFLPVLAANFVANILRNVWTFMVIICGHFPQGVHHFSREDVDNESRGQWYRRQVLGSCNIRGSRVLEFATGHLSHQIEHHLFPELPSHRLPNVASEVESLCAQHGLSYNMAGFGRQLGTSLRNLMRLSFPGGDTQPSMKTV